MNQKLATKKGKEKRSSGAVATTKEKRSSGAVATTKEKRSSGIVAPKKTKQVSGKSKYTNMTVLDVLGEDTQEAPESPVSKILCVGDLHFQKNNLSELPLFIDRVMKMTQKLKPDFVVVLGDILHTHEKLLTQPLNYAVEFLKRLSSVTKTFVLIGNHDYINASQFLSEQHPFMSLKEWKHDVVIVDKVTKHESHGFTFFFVPFVPPGRFEEALNSSDELWETADAIFAHQEFYGCQMGSIKSENGDRWDENYPPVFSGHIHSIQHVEPNIYYVGSAMQNHFSEDAEKRLGYLEFKEEKGEDGETEVVFEYKKVNLKLPKKITIQFTDMQKLSDLDVKKIIKKHPQDKLRLQVKLKGTREEFNAFKKSKKYRELRRAGIDIKSESVWEDVDNEIIKKFDGIVSYRDILISLLKEDELRQVYAEATGDML